MRRRHRSRVPGGRGPRVVGCAARRGRTSCAPAATLPEPILYAPASPCDVDELVDALDPRSGDTDVQATPEPQAEGLAEAPSGAEAEAEALELIAAALEDNPQLIEYQYVLKLAPGVQTIFVPSGNQFILPLPQNSTETVSPTVTP